MLAQRKRSSGFSLMELMIVVVITGVLATIAIPTFITYVQKSRTAEATQFLGVIKLRQESYRAEFGTYFQCPANANEMTEFSFSPALNVVKGGKSVGLPDPNNCFAGLGARPDGPVRFGYGWIAGTPGALTASVTGPLGLTNAEIDHFFVAHAIGDLDGDNTTVVFELSNFTRNVFVGRGDTGGVIAGPLAAGWE